MLTRSGRSACSRSESPERLSSRQTHPDPTLVEHGQLLAMYVRDFDDVYTISD